MAPSPSRAGAKHFRVHGRRRGAKVAGILGFLLFFASVFVLHNPWAVALSLLASSAVEAFSKTGLDLVVGRDGVRLLGARQERFVAYDRFVPYTDVTAVEATHGGCVLVLRGGERLPLRDEAIWWRAGFRTENAVFAAVSEAWQARETREEVGTALLARGGRASRAWLDDARGLLRSKPSYRVSVADPESLLGLVSDPGIARDVRVGALLALAAAPEHAEAMRVRVAELADPVVRRIGDVATSPEVDDEALLRALDEPDLRGP